MIAVLAQTQVFLLLTEWEIWGKQFGAVESVFLFTKWDCGFWVPCQLEWKQDVESTASLCRQKPPSERW